jgi:hypothetical protein
MKGIDYSTWGNTDTLWVIIGIILFAAVGTWLLRRFCVIHVKGGETRGKWS